MNSLIVWIAIGAVGMVCTGLGTMMTGIILIIIASKNNRRNKELVKTIEKQTLNINKAINDVSTKVEDLERTIKYVQSKKKKKSKNVK